MIAEQYPGFYAGSEFQYSRDHSLAMTKKDKKHITVIIFKSWVVRGVYGRIISAAFNYSFIVIAATNRARENFALPILKLGQ